MRGIVASGVSVMGTPSSPSAASQSLQGMSFKTLSLDWWLLSWLKCLNELDMIL